MCGLHDRLLAVAEAAMRSPAVDAGRAGDFSYSQLFAAAEALIPKLAGKSAVGILSNRRPETYPAVLAAFLAGVTFVPLNPSFPPERLATIARLAAVDLVLFDSANAELADTLGLTAQALEDADTTIARTAAPDWDALRTALPTDDGAIAYRLFTSGSTGEPKGVPIPVGALTHYVRHIRETVSIPQGKRFSQLFDLSFDLSMHDIFVCFASGGCLVPASDMNLLLPHAYAAKKRIEVWFSVPMLAMTAARGLATAGKEPEHRIALAQFCGEPLPMDYVRGFRALMQPGAPVWNLYGPTEATIAFTAQRMDDSEESNAIATLGEPFGANALALLADDGSIGPLREGARGELLLGGPQVFGGYAPARHDPFVAGEDGARWYRSGDSVAMQDGKLHHRGRIDSQVKLRGHRIELAEIESAFRNRMGCEAAAAIVHGEADAAEIRVAYEAGADIEDLAPVAAALPGYMVPARTLRLDALPLNANGKVDRRRLAEMTWPDAA